MKNACCIALLLPALYAAAAAAQPSAPDRASMALSVSTPPGEIAQSIVIFVPTVDTPLVTGDEDVYLTGAIMRTVHSRMASHPAGIPVRFYLMRHPERDAWYPIYSTVVEPDLADAAHEMLLSMPRATLAVQTYSPLVSADTDPGDTANWIAEDFSPLFVQ